MPTQKQIEANRRNSQKSTGPRSVEGKAASSQNALQSGIYALSQVIRGENSATLDRLSQEYYDRYRPTTPAERMLVDTLIDCEWLLRRFRVVEAHLWECSILDLDLVPPADAILAPAYAKTRSHLDRLQSRINATQRNYRNALKELERLQAASRQAEPPQPEQAQPEPNQPLTTPIGFVPPASVETPAPAAQTSPERKLYGSAYRL